MKNKVLVKVIVPELDVKYDIFIPVNEQLWKVNKLIVKSIYDLVGLRFDSKTTNYVIINKSTGKVYQNNSIVYDSDIRNGTELVLLSMN